MHGGHIIINRLESSFCRRYRSTLCILCSYSYLNDNWNFQVWCPAIFWLSSPIRYSLIACWFSGVPYENSVTRIVRNDRLSRNRFCFRSRFNRRIWKLKGRLRTIIRRLGTSWISMWYGRQFVWDFHIRVVFRGIQEDAVATLGIASM